MVRVQWIWALVYPPSVRFTPLLTSLNGATTQTVLTSVAIVSSGESRWYNWPIFVVGSTNSTQGILRISHSEDRASWYTRILIIKTNEIHCFSSFFSIEFYMHYFWNLLWYRTLQHYFSNLFWHWILHYFSNLFWYWILQHYFSNLFWHWILQHFFSNLFWHWTLQQHFSNLFWYRTPHQVYFGIELYILISLADSQHNLYDIHLSLCIQY